MKLLGRAVALMLAVFTANALCATAEDAIDRDIGRQAAAKAVADLLITDQAYETFLIGIASTGEIEEYLSSEGPTKAAEADQSKAKEAVVAAMMQLVPRSLYADGMATALAGMFSYSELKQILTFARSDVGKRYNALTYDQKFAESLMQSVFKGKETPDPRPLLEREFKARFPSMTFKF
jgi:hypothetical protein